MSPDIAFTLDTALVIQLLVSTVLPLLVGLVTKTVTRPGVKAVLLGLFALATSLLVELGAAVTAGTTYDIGQGLLLALPTFLIAVGLHYGLWKPVGAAEKAQKMFTSSTATEVRIPRGMPGMPGVNAAQIDHAVSEYMRRAEDPPGH